MGFGAEITASLAIWADHLERQIRDTIRWYLCCNVLPITPKRVFGCISILMSTARFIVTMESRLSPYSQPQHLRSLGPVCIGLAGLI